MTGLIRKTTAALAFVAFAAGTGAAFAQQGPGGDDGAGGGEVGIERAGEDDDGRRGGPRGRFARADADNSGDVSFDEFAAAMNRRVTGADANGDGRMTVAEIADELQRIRFERQARRIIDRFDVNGDGELTTEEVRSRQEKRFALMDRNEDGKLQRDEMRRRDGRRWERRHRHD